MAEQLPLDLPTRMATGRDAFFISPANAMALATLDGHNSWPSGKLALIGPKGAGKTHLAHVWAADTGAAMICASDLADSDIPTLASTRFVVVEDADDIATLSDARAAEEALFHLHNLTLAEGGRLLVTAAVPPSAWHLTLPDLASRMQATTVTRLDAPDDALLAALMVKQFDDRQIAITPALIDYLVRRIDRSAEAARAIVDRLDRAALAQGKGVTRALAARLLGDETDG